MTLAECQKILMDAARDDFPPVVEDAQDSDYEARSHHAEYGAAQH